MTKVSMPIIGWVSEILGWMINVIYSGLELIGITNIGLSIILFTLVVYLLMTPLQIKQQKFSKLCSLRSRRSRRNIMVKKTRIL